MKKAPKKMTVLGPEGIEDGLMGMGRLIEAGGAWVHVEMDRIPEWRGADVRITSDFAKEFNDPKHFDHDLTVRTRHAGPVTWFIFQMRDLFDGWLDWGNKYGFYELLAQAALEQLAANQPEPEDARPILRAMLTRAFLMLEVAKEHHASREIEHGIWKIGGGGRWKVEGLGKGNGSGKPAKRTGLVALRMSHPLGQHGRMVERPKIVPHSYESRIIRRLEMRTAGLVLDQAERKRGSWSRIFRPKGARVCSTSRPRYFLWTSLAKANRRTCSQAVCRPNRALSRICHRVSRGSAWRSWRISIRRWLATPLNTLSSCRRINGSI